MQPNEVYPALTKQPELYNYYSAESSQIPTSNALGDLHEQFNSQSQHQNAPNHSVYDWHYQTPQYHYQNPPSQSNHDSNIDMYDILRWDEEERSRRNNVLSGPIVDTSSVQWSHNLDFYANPPPSVYYPQNQNDNSMGVESSNFALPSQSSFPSSDVTIVPSDSEDDNLSETGEQDTQEGTGAELYGVWRDVPRLKSYKRKNKIAPWKKGLRGSLMQAYFNYGRIMKYSITTCFIHIDTVADKDLTMQLLDPDLVIQEKAAHKIYQQVRKLLKMKSRSPVEWLGNMYDQTLFSFMKATDSGEARATKFIKKALTPHIANLINSSDTFDDGIAVLAYIYANQPRNRVKTFDPSTIVIESSEVAKQSQEEASRSDRLEKKKAAPREIVIDGQTLLGNYYQLIHVAFQKVTGKDRKIVAKFIKENVTPELAVELRNKATREEGMITLLRMYRDKRQAN